MHTTVLLGKTKSPKHSTPVNHSASQGSLLYVHCDHAPMPVHPVPDVTLNTCSSAPTPVQQQPYVKRQQEYISDDVYRCCNPDIHAPFRNLQDALDRLLPYHVRPFRTSSGRPHAVDGTR